MVHKDHAGACSGDTGVMRLLRAVTWPQRWPQGEIAVRRDWCTVSRSAQPGQARAQDQHIRQSSATLHKSPIPNMHAYIHTEAMKTTQRDKREHEWKQRKGDHGRRGVVGEGDEEKKSREGKKASHPSVPADRQWRSSLSVSLGWGSGALQRLWPT